MNICSKPENIISKSTISIIHDLYKSIAILLDQDPLTIINLIKQMKSIGSTIRDNIFFECLEAYILNFHNYNDEGNQFIENNLKRLACCLADMTPNSESGFEGNVEKLHEYSNRIVKLIDDLGTVQKSIYLANISRALVNYKINKKTFFKLAQCIRMLIEEDLLFLKENVKEGPIHSTDESIADFAGLGLVYESEIGLSYSLKAFLLSKYALNYEKDVRIPEKFPSRLSVAEDWEVNEMLEDVFQKGSS